MVRDIADLDREMIDTHTKGVVEADKQCRIRLADDAESGINLEWNPGGRNGKLSIIRVEPGKSVVQPLSKAMAWFGPFAVPLEFMQTTDERKREHLRKFWNEEKSRYLNRFDYPRGDGRGQQADMRPTGPHRAPHVIVTIINDDGSESEPIDTHALYKIGEYDPIKGQFAVRESEESIKARFQSELDEKEAQTIALRRDVATLTGMVQGIAAGKK